MGEISINSVITVIVVSYFNVKTVKNSHYSGLYNTH